MATVMMKRPLPPFEFMRKKLSLASPAQFFSASLGSSSSPSSKYGHVLLRCVQDGQIYKNKHTEKISHLLGFFPLHLTPGSVIVG
jgi:hypothetical protein